MGRPKCGRNRSHSKAEKLELEKQRAPEPNYSCTVTRVSSTHPQVIPTYLNHTTQFKVCQEPERQEIMPLLNLSLEMQGCFALPLPVLEAR